MTALAVRDDQDFWDSKQIATLRQAGIDEDVTSAELASFLHLCQRTKLDPFARQIYLIGRWSSAARRKVYTPQTGIDGYRVVAQRTCAAGTESLGYEDTLWCGEDGRWTDVWLAPAPPAAAKVVVLRNGQRFPVVALWTEYQQTDKEGKKPIGLWAKMPAAQLAKCAEALALRKAFPNDLAGVYTTEEMAQADNTAPATHLTAVTASAVAPQVPEPEPNVWADPTTGEILDAEVVPFPETDAGALDTAPASARPRGQVSDKQLGLIAVLFEKCGWNDRADRLRAASKIVGRDIDSAKSLVSKEASELIAVLKLCAEDTDPQGALAGEVAS